MRPRSFWSYVLTGIIAVVVGVGLSIKSPAATFIDNEAAVEELTDNLAHDLVHIAAELDPMQAATIYALAHSVSGLPLPAQPPEVHLTTANAIDRMLTSMGVCPRGCPRVKAAQVGNRVYVDEALDMQDIQNAAIVFHEFVHYLQWAKGGDAQTCEEWRDREITAYQLQNLVLSKAGARMVQAPTMPACPGDSKKKEPLPEQIPLERKAEHGHYTQS